jgi:hypothetical protein
MGLYSRPARKKKIRFNSILFPTRSSARAKFSPFTWWRTRVSIPVPLTRNTWRQNVWYKASLFGLRQLPEGINSSYIPCWHFQFKMVSTVCHQMGFFDDQICRDSPVFFLFQLHVHYIRPRAKKVIMGFCLSKISQTLWDDVWKVIRILGWQMALGFMY